MTITRTYSSWTRNRLTPEIRERIREAGPGEVEFHPAMGKPLGWVGCRVVTEDRSSWAVGPNPGAAFDAARLQIVTVLA